MVLEVGAGADGTGGEAHGFVRNAGLENDDRAWDDALRSLVSVCIFNVFLAFTC